MLRDYLRANENARKNYQELKEKLTKEHSTNKLAYADSKTDSINKIILKAERGRQ